MKVAAYVRVSTEEQVEKGNSILEQQDRLAAYCRAMSWDPPTFFIDDGYSAKNLKRPAVSRLLDAVDGGAFDVLVVTKLDRLCRNLLDLLQLVDRFESGSCRFVSASESFDTSTAAGRMTLHLLGMFAQFERERISERVKDNMLSLARNTDKSLTKPCYGYDVDGGFLVVSVAEAEFVRMMFRLAEEGAGHRKIAQMLNEAGARTKSGKLWDQSSVKRLLVNETVTGRKVFNRRRSAKGGVEFRDPSEWVVREKSHPPIIGDDQFERVQQLLRSRRSQHARSASETYLLTGLVWCKYCGGRMKGASAKQTRNGKEFFYARYICAAYVAGYGCRHHAVHRDPLESAVIAEIRRMASLSASGVAPLALPSSVPVDALADAKSRLSSLDRRLQKQLEAYELDLISAADLRLARDRVDGERRKLLEHIARLESARPDEAEFRARVSSVLDAVSGTDRAKAKRSMSELIDRVVVADAELEIGWKLYV